MRQTTLWAIVLLLSAACDERKSADTSAASSASATAALSATPTNAPAASTSAKEEPLAPGFVRYAITMGKGSFLIHAPLEDIKGTSDEIRGHLDVNPKDLAKSRGEIDVRMSTLKTATFGETDKDAAQTEHARNWMEVGNDAPGETRMKYEWALLVLTEVDATPSTIADAKEQAGVRAVKAKVSGDFTLHGVTSKKTVAVTVTFTGPPDAPTDVAIKTDQPMILSLKEQDIKPRDKVGSLLNGALERIGKKIDDKVQVSFDASAKLTMPPMP